MKIKLYLILSFTIIFTIIIIVSCKKEEPKPPAGLTNKIIMQIDSISICYYNANANVYSYISSLGDKNIKQHGHCWDTASSPSLGEGAGGWASQLGALKDTGIFTSQLINLEPNTKYYVKAYIQFDALVLYSEQDSFTISFFCGAPFKDTRDGQIYNTVQIGTQCWMAENLNYYTDSCCSWCYDNNAGNCNTYGRLYDWEAALTVAPAGWHIPTDEEWKTLEMELGMSQAEADATGWRGTDEGGKLKETGCYIHWISPNEGATNESGFTALPGGYHSYYESFFSHLGYGSYFWASTECGSSFAWSRLLVHNNARVSRVAHSKTNSYSVRCLKD